jgi:hypothetical protein
MAKKTDIKDFIDLFEAMKNPDPVLREYSIDSTALDKWTTMFKERGGVGVMDPANVAMVWTDSERIMHLMAALFPNYEPQKQPSLLADGRRAGGAKYSPEYLKHVFKALSCIDTGVAPRITTGQDYPLMVEWFIEDGHRVIYYLAPRVDND